MQGGSFQEDARLAALDSYQILDTDSEAAYDAITRAAASICGTPIALISLVDRNRQWFKSVVGLSVTETPRDIAFCDHAIRDTTFFEIPNAEDDIRFAKNPLVTGDPNIRFYAGVPLIGVASQPLGTLCVIDNVPRALSGHQKTALKELAAVAIHLLAARRADANTKARLNKVIEVQARLANVELDLDAFLTEMLSLISETTTANGAILAIREGEELVVKAATGSAFSGLDKPLNLLNCGAPLPGTNPKIFSKISVWNVGETIRALSHHENRL